MSHVVLAERPNPVRKRRARLRELRYPTPPAEVQARYKITNSRVVPDVICIVGTPPADDPEAWRRESRWVLDWALGEREAERLRALAAAHSAAVAAAVPVHRLISQAIGSAHTGAAGAGPPSPTGPSTLTRDLIAAPSAP